MRTADVNGKSYTRCKDCPNYRNEDGEQFCGEGGFVIADATEIDWECLNKEDDDEEPEEEEYEMDEDYEEDFEEDEE